MRVSVEHDADTFVRFEKKVCFEIRTRGKFNGFFIVNEPFERRRSDGEAAAE